MNKTNDCKPNLVTYNSLLDCAVHSNRFEEMESIFQNIISNLKPDLITHSTYIKGLCKSNDAIRAYKLFLEIRNGSEFIVDEVLYNSVLDGLLKSREYEKCKEIYELMMKDSIKPSNVTYSILIKLFSN